MFRQILAISALTLATAPTIALNANTALANSSPQVSRIAARTQVNGRNVNLARHTNGYFANRGNGSWAEVDRSNRVRFNFKETGRDAWSVYLLDRSRNVRIQLDLHRKKIVYSNKTQRFDLYSITSSSVTAPRISTPRPTQPKPRPKSALERAVNPGRLDRKTGTVYISPITAYKSFRLPSLSQKGNISLTINPKLVKGADGSKYLHVDLDGSTVSASQSRLGKDSKTQRGWYLEKVTTKITPLNRNIRFLKAADFSGGGESGSVTSSLSQTISGSGSFSGKSGNGSLGFSETIGRSYSRNLRGFSALTPNLINRTTVVNDYKLSGILFEGDQGLKPYSSWSSIVDKEIEDSFWGGFGSVFTTKAWSGFKVHGLPERAKKGLPLMSQAIFNSGSNFSQPVKVRVEVYANLRRVWVTGKTKIDARSRTQSTRPIKLTKDIVVDFGFRYPTN